MLKKKSFINDDKLICEDLMQVDTIITNCSIVRHDETLNAGIAIDRGKIVAVAKDSQLPLAKTIIDGTQLDDLGDYRPGIDALRSNGIRSPLVEIGFTKNQIRNESKKIGLSVYDRPSNSCLASRIPWGQRVTAERLTRIEVGESIVKQILHVNQVRVRDFDGVAKIEIEKNDLEQLSDKTKLNEISNKLEQIGFKSVLIDPEGYKSGKINVLAD